jgi:epoxyqueuosine reductase
VPLSRSGQPESSSRLETPIDMTPAERGERVKAEANRAGFDLCGIATAAPIPRADFLERWLADGFAGGMSYLHRRRGSRIDVRAWLPWARSVVVVALTYHQREPAVAVARPGGGTGNLKSEISDAPSAFGGLPPELPNPRSAAPLSTFSILHSQLPPRGRVARYAWGEDYHVVLREKLDAFLARLRGALAEPFQARACVDTSAVIERELAAAAGVGWIGKNTMVLHPRIGSFFFLGEIITDLELSPDQPLPDHCGACTRCLEACPTSAFPSPHVMDARRCIAYLTIEHRGEIDAGLAAKMGDWVFGCDICQEVCPYNRRAPDTAEPRFHAGPTSARPVLADILSWDETAHRAFVGGRACRRANLPMWRRNAAIAERNLAAEFRDGGAPGPPS